MSDKHDEHGHADDGGVHPHVHSERFYYAVFGALITLTVITVATSYIDIDGIMVPGTPHGAGGFNLGLAMLIATTKATCVCLWFMHLRDDKKFNAIFFVSSVVFAGVFFFYTNNDTAYRGHSGDPYNGVQVHPQTGERAPGGFDTPFAGEAPAPGVTAPPAAEHEEEGAHDDAADHAAEHGGH